MSEWWGEFLYQVEAFVADYAVLDIAALLIALAVIFSPLLFA